MVRFPLRPRGALAMLVGLLSSLLLIACAPRGTPVVLPPTVSPSGSSTETRSNAAPSGGPAGVASAPPEASPVAAPGTTLSPSGVTAEPVVPANQPAAPAQTGLAESAKAPIPTAAGASADPPTSGTEQAVTTSPSASPPPAPVATAVTTTTVMLDDGPVILTTIQQPTAHLFYHPGLPAHEAFRQQVEARLAARFQDAPFGVRLVPLDAEGAPAEADRLGVTALPELVSTDYLGDIQDRASPGATAAEIDTVFIRLILSCRLCNWGS